MFKRVSQGALLALCVMCGAAMFASGAWASSTPTLSLDQSAGNTAGATQNLGMDLSFSDSSGDSPDAMTINLPPGLLANANIDGGACLQTADLTDTNCQVGTGTVTANALDLVPVPLSVTFDLVPPPAAGDLAGLAVNFDNGTQIGDTAGIKVRPSGDPDGVGLSLYFVLPNTIAGTSITPGAPIQITQIDSTFDGLRYPTSCPSTAADVSVSVNSYDDSTSQSVSKPLPVTGCSSLPFAPKVTIAATKDSSDREAALTATITQAANEATTGAMTLGFAGNALGLNLGSVKALCLNVASGTCTPVGVATATSPLYPTPLTAEAYLTGNVNGLTLTLPFPAPFPLTLVGKVDLENVTTTFTGMPDIPLTNLQLKLNGGADALFATNCRPATGAVTGSITDQNADKTVTSSNPYTISGCAASGSTTTTTTSTGTTVTADNTPTVSGVSLSGVTVSNKNSKHPSLSFKVGVAKKASKLTALTVELPKGLSFIRHGSAKHPKVTGVSLKGAKLKSLKLSRGHLVITLKKAVRSLTVNLTTTSLTENSALAASVKSGKVKSLPLIVIATNTKHRRYTVRYTIRHLG
jgi:hypothetical protein